MKARRHITAAFWLGLVLPLHAGVPPEPAAPALRVPLVNEPPYGHMDEAGEAGGLRPALLRELGRRLGRPVQFMATNPRAARQGLERGRFDVYILPRAEEWSAELWFSPTVLFHYRYAVLAAPKTPATLTALADLAGRKVAVVSHDAGEILLSRIGGVERIAVPDYRTGMNLVADGHAEFFVGNQDVCVYLISAGKAPALRPAMENVILTPAAFAVSRNNASLIDAVHRAAQDMSRDGTIDQLASSWLGREFPAVVQPSWLVRHARTVSAAALAMLVVLLAFIGALQVLVNRRTRSLSQAQGRLRQSETLYRQIFNTANDAIFLTDLEGRIVACSERVLELYGYHPTELTGQSMEALVPEEKRAQAAERRNYLIRHGDNIYEAEHRRKGGERMQVELSERIIDRQDRGKVIVSCVRDITGRRQTEQALAESQSKLLRAHRMEMAGLMAGQIAHDFNNLLSPMLGLPDLIREEIPENAQARADLDLIRASAQRMAEISQQLLTLGRRGQVHTRPADVNRIVQETLATLDPRRTEGVEVIRQLSPQLPPVLGGANQLMRAVSNLVWNAVEAMPNGGRLTVKTDVVRREQASAKSTTSEAGDFVRLIVEDTGAGIPETVLDRIFDPFYTTKSASRQRGSGLGLSVVQAVVQDHKGFIEVQSRVGQGSRFTVYLPVCRLPVEPEPAAATALVRGTERLLIVDDDEMQISVFRRILSGLGYQVTSATSGDQAVERVKQQAFDLVLLDMVMESGIDGTETYRRILHMYPHQRALIVTGYAEVQRVAEVQRLGAGPVLRKPVSREALARAVREEIDRGRALQSTIP
jgi:PAS domain S-box-containing protein